MVALLGMVANTGRQAGLKVRAQNGADAVAMTSATWIARGLNVHSAINVTQTQLIGGSIVMHANHQAVLITHPSTRYRTSIMISTVIGDSPDPPMLSASVCGNWVCDRNALKISAPSRIM